MYIYIYILYYIILYYIILYYIYIIFKFKATKVRNVYKLKEN